MDLTILVVLGLAAMPGLIEGPSTDSVGMSYCAPSCPPAVAAGVPAKTSPVYQLPCGPGFGHSTAYNYGVYPVAAAWSYQAPARARNCVASPYAPSAEGVRIVQK